jgi:hypothetical protein
VAPNANPLINPNSAANSPAVARQALADAAAASALAASLNNAGLVFDSRRGALRVLQAPANQLASQPTTNGALQVNDQIVSVNGERVGTTQQFLSQLMVNVPSDGLARVEVNRNGGVESVLLDPLSFRTGLRFADPVANQAGLLRVGSVISGSLAARAGLVAGDELTAINGRQVLGVASARSLLNSALHSPRNIALQIRRDGVLRTIRLPSAVVAATANQPARVAQGADLVIQPQRAVAEAAPTPVDGSSARVSTRSAPPSSEPTPTLTASVSNASATIASLRGPLDKLRQGPTGQVRQNQDVEQIRTQIVRLDADLNGLLADRTGESERRLSEVRAGLGSIRDRVRWLRVDAARRPSLTHLQNVLDHLGHQLDAIDLAHRQSEIATFSRESWE